MLVSLQMTSSAITVSTYNNQRSLFPKRHPVESIANVKDNGLKLYVLSSVIDYIGAWVKTR